MKTIGMCSKDDYKPTEVLLNGLRIVRYDAYTDDNGTMFYTEETVQNNLTSVKELMLRLVREYDVSDKVNGFAITHGGSTIGYWLPAAERGQLLTGVNARKACGNDSYVLDLRNYGVSLEIPCDTLIDMLNKLENYAVECYNATSKHINAINAMTDIDDVVAYDYKDGYPDKVNFEL